MYNCNFPNFCAKLAIFSEKKQGKDTKFDFLMFFFEENGCISNILLIFVVNINRNKQKNNKKGEKKYGKKKRP